MDQRDNDWMGKMIAEQEDFEQDQNLGKVHLEKTISKKQQDSFLPQKELGVNMRRKDSGTKATESKRHEYKRDDTRLEADFKKKRERIFEKQEMELESMTEEPVTETDDDQSEAAEDERDGLAEFRNLANGRGEFLYKEEDEYFDDESEPTNKELKRIEMEEARWEREQARKNREFKANQTYSGNRLGGQDARGMR